MIIKPYNHKMQEDWDSFIEESKNGTFLFYRNYMDYHKDRFHDCSLLFIHKKKIVGAFPASWHPKDAEVISHGGLTYGGLVLSKNISFDHVNEIFELLCTYYVDKFDAKILIYKPVPSIYYSYLSEEYSYILFKRNAQRIACGFSSTIKMENKIEFSSSRKEGIKKALNNDCEIKLATSPLLQDFWIILTHVLNKYHNTPPTHSFEEIDLLHTRFPQQIKSYVVLSKGVVIAGAVVFDMKRVAHVQYIAASDEAKCVGALDFLFDYLINKIYTDKKYIDFGISTEDGGSILNEGLLFQKEGFGGRGICYNTYKIMLQ